MIKNKMRKVEMRNAMSTMTNHKPSKLKVVMKALLVIIGGLIAAYGLEAVLIPNNVSDGGVTGLKYRWLTIIWITIRTFNCSP